MKKLFVTALALILLITALAGCGQQPGNQPTTTTPTPTATKEPVGEDLEPFYVAFAEPMTGDAAQYGEYAYNAIMIKIDEVNAAGGINGRKIVVDVFDDKSEAKEATNIAQKISDEEKYLCVFGSYNSTCSLAIAPIYEENKVVHFCPTAGHMDLPSYEYTFVQALGAPLEFKLFSKLAVERVGGKKIGLIHINNDNGLETLKALQEWIPKYGAELTLTDSYNEGQIRDFTAMLTKFKEANVDLMCVNGTYADDAAILIQARQLGMECKFMFASPANNSDFIQAAGEYAEDCFVVATFSALDTTPSVAEFVKKYVARTGKEPTSFAQQPYEQACMLVKALEEGATDRESLYRILMSWDRWEGDTYSADLVNRRPQRDTLILLKVKDGKWVYAE